MKRGTPLKRRAMKRPKRKPTPVLDAYRDSCGLDEIAFELGIVLKDNLGFVASYIGHEVPATETNHLFTNSRHDLWSNLIRLSAPAHRYFHRSIDVGRVLCLAAKSRKRERLGDPREFDFDELLVCRKNLIGWLEAVELPPWINCYRDETLRRLKENERKKWTELAALLACVPDLSLTEQRDMQTDDDDELKFLREILECLKTAESDYQRGFLEGRALEITRLLDEHPEWWDGRACMCSECQDAVADYC